MNKIEFLKKIKEQLAFMGKDGYVLQEIENTFWYEKQGFEKGFAIKFSWIAYSNIQVKGIGAYIRYNSVENEIQKVLGENSDDYYTIYVHPEIKYIPRNLAYKKFEHNIHFEIETLEDIDLLVNFIKSFYIKQCVIFFESYNDLEVVNVKLKDLLENKKITSVITNFGNNAAIMRYYAIALLCKNKYIFNFFEQTYFPYLKQNLNNPLDQREFEILNRLKDNLYKRDW